jgi:hypothetical protein
MGCTADALGHVFRTEGAWGNFQGAYTALGGWLKNNGDEVDTGHWQSLKDVPQTKTRELRSVVLMYSIPDSVEQLHEEINPSTPWAEDHFQERVAGEPLNPGEQYKNWPWYKGNVETHKEPGQFSHTYMERYWPRYAGEIEKEHRANGFIEEMPHRGIRYRYGDLADVVSLLAKEPHTRQAYLPVWFPEDTGATSGQRVPCSLGYHFMLRNGELHCLYTIRSCDYLRHFRDDVYLTARLVQWVASRVRSYSTMVSTESAATWESVKPGELTMMIHSLHIFEGDMPKMEREYGTA